MDAIRSKQNPLCIHLRRLADSRSYRRERGEFFCDSPKLLEEALHWGAEIRAVLYTADAALPPLPAGIRAAEVTAEVMRSVSPMEAPQGVVFSCAMCGSDPPALLTGSRYLVLDGIQDPGNLGTMLRTADAFDCEGLFLLPGCADIYNPKTLRSAMGVLFRRPVWRCELETLCALLREGDIPLYGAALREDTADVRTLDMKRCAVAIGNEGHGLSEAVLRRCDRTVKIPMSERCESLNAAAAAAVLLWEMYR